jgi:hypothetical protein
MDILEANLNAGISVQKYVPSYGDAPNDIEHVTRCKRRFIHGLLHLHYTDILTQTSKKSSGLTRSVETINLFNFPTN